MGLSALLLANDDFFNLLQWADAPSASIVLEIHDNGNN